MNLAIDTLRRWREDPLAFVRELFKVEPDPWQQEVLSAFPHKQRIALKAPIALDSVVPTPSGLRIWGDVQVGDSLFAEDGSITTVKKRFDAGTVPLYRVRFRDGTSLRVSGDHEWDVQTPYDRKVGTRRTVTTAQLRGMRLVSGGQRHISIPSQRPAQYPVAKLPADPYLFGLWLGDGIANEPRLICPDQAIRREIIKRGQEISESASVPKRIGLLKWAGSLRSTGMMSCRSFEKYIPENYKIASINQRLDLLRGLMDSDGTCAKNGHTYLASCSEKLIEDFIWLARSLGYSATKMGPYKINGGENRDSYRAVLCGEICPFLAQTAKRKRWRKPVNGKTLRFIDAIEPAGEAEAMCVEIAHPSHCFQATDFIVTHNCKGPGKTACEAWLAWNFLLTRPHPKIAATSITSENLADNLWAEMAKWQQKSELLKAAFQWTKTRIFAKDHPETWWMSARTWPKSADKEQQANTLAGLHADYILFLLDESGGMPEAVMASAEAALSSCIEGHIVQAGNPTHLEGPLYKACTSDRTLWFVVEITADPDDPKRSTRVKVEWAREQIQKYGRDNPWVLVNVFGRFPPASLNALIGPDEVRAAMQRMYRAEDIAHSARVLGVDVAREGDDASVIFPRQGLVAFPPQKYRNVDGNFGAGVVGRKFTDWDADAVFVDNTGGFGSSWIDAGTRLGYSFIPVGFADGATKNERYFNKRAEMAFECVEWVKNGGMLPDLPELLAAMTRTTYTFRGDRLLLEPKDQVKIKLGYSPDEFDALMLTFAQPVQRKPAFQVPGSQGRGFSADWNPMAEHFAKLQQQKR